MSLVQNPVYEGDSDIDSCDIGMVKKILYVNTICSPKYALRLLGTASRMMSLLLELLPVCIDASLPSFTLLLEAIMLSPSLE